MNLKFLFPLIGISIGIFVSSEVFQGLRLGLILLGLALFIWCVLTLVSKNPLKAIKIKNWHWVWILLLFAGIGSLDYNLRSLPEVPYELNDKKAKFIGIIEEVKYLADGDRFKVKITSIQDSNKILKCRNLNFLLKTDGYLGSKGDNITFEAVPKKISEKNNKTGYAYRLIHQGIQYTANVKSVNISKIGQDFSLSSIFYDWRNHFIIQLENSSLERDTSELLISVLLGDKTFLSSEVKQTLNSAGMAHVLALSGMHVAILLSIFLWLLFPLSLAGKNKTRKIFAILIIWGYVFLTGAAPSTVRAAIMASFILGAFLLERKNSSLNSLLGATTIILIINPWSLWDVGLQLSFICVASIIIFTNRLNPIDRHSHPKLFYIANIVLITLVTTVCSWTLISYYFNSVPLLFLPANLILLPILPLYIACGMLYVCLLNLGIDWMILARFLDTFTSIFVGSADVLSLSGKATLSYKIPIVSTVLWLVGIMVLGYILNSKQNNYKKISVGIVTVSILFSIVFLPTTIKDETLKLKFIHSFTKLEVHHYKDSELTKLEFNRNGISNMNLPNINILAIDNAIQQDSLQNLKNVNNIKTRILFVGIGASIEQIGELINEASFSKIILHSNIGKNKKSELLSIVKDSEIDKIYSLRENGSLELEL